MIPRPIKPQISFREFVLLIASLMALTALGIDAMLPALPAIGRSLQLLEPNRRQWIITSYFFGMSAMQLFFGPVSDRFGRRRILLSCLLGYAGFSLLAAFSGSFAMMMGARFCQGIAAAGTRVLAVAIVRDRYSGARMAKVISLAFVIFLGVPILAPSLGQLILHIAAWPMIFYALAAFGTGVAVWAALRLRETLPEEHREVVSFRSLLAAWRFVLTDRVSIGYTLAGACMFGAMVSFLSSVQQIYSDIFNAPNRFPAVFAAMAGAMALTSILNSRIVERIGMRKVSHWALGFFTVFAGTHVAIAWAGLETELSFVLFQSAVMGCFPLVVANFNATAMEPMGEIAGSAASLQGFITSLGGAVLGVIVGQCYNGTTVPLALGFFVFAVTAAVFVVAAERS